jgi:hypothetical protein
MPVKTAFIVSVLTGINESTGEVGALPALRVKTLLFSTFLDETWVLRKRDLDPKLSRARGAESRRAGGQTA